MIKRVCKQCGKNFTITDSEVNFYNSKNLELPKRCSKCRKENKNSSNNTKSNIDNTNIENKQQNNNYENNKHKKSKKRNVIGSIVAAVLIVAFLFIGKIFNISLNWDQIGLPNQNEQNNISLEFRNEKLWEEHFIKHKDEFTYSSKEEYLKGANSVVNSLESMHKQEGEDGDDIYYNKSKNEIVFVSSDGYIRTYFKPSDGINYFNKQ